MYSNQEFKTMFEIPVIALEYRDLAGPLTYDAGMQMPGEDQPAKEVKTVADMEFSLAEFAERVKNEREDATRQAEQRLRQELEQKLQNERKAIAATIKAFEAERIDYYARVEAEVVQLALAIAAKILHREAQVDPMLLPSLVRFAVGKIHEGSSIIVRVNPRRAKLWRDYFAQGLDGASVEVKEDAALSDLDCMLETEVGTTNLGLNSQLKEVEQGFFDLLALKPVGK
jgi:flagellar assembly protein FliH